MHVQSILRGSLTLKNFKSKSYLTFCTVKVDDVAVNMYGETDILIYTWWYLSYCNVKGMKLNVQINPNYEFTLYCKP